MILSELFSNILNTIGDSLKIFLPQILHDLIELQLPFLRFFKTRYEFSHFIVGVFEPGPA